MKSFVSSRLSSSTFLFIPVGLPLLRYDLFGGENPLLTNICSLDLIISFSTPLSMVENLDISSDSSQGPSTSKQLELSGDEMLSMLKISPHQAGPLECNFFYNIVKVISGVLIV